MKKFTLAFLALSRSMDFEIKSDNDIDELAGNFLFLFAKDIDYENFKAELESLQRNTNDFRKNLNKFVEKYKKVEPKIQQLNSYFQSLKDNEYFFVLPNTLTKDERFDLSNYLFALDSNEDYEKLSGQMAELFGEVRNNYEMSAFDKTTRNKIGEPQKAKRICRYCNKGADEVKFKKIAHTISEALGNKKIITNDECDNCNEKFGNGIEKDLILYLDFFRTLFGIKGKNGIPKVRGKNFKIENEGTIKIEHTLTEEEINDANRDEFKARLESNENIIVQNIYRTLSKYALGVIDKSELIHFQETIEWINGDKIFDDLPKIAVLTSYNLYSHHPKMMVYLRKNDNYDLPFAVVELRFTFLTFVYIIPKSSKDKKDFSQPEAFKNFWKFFKHYSLVKDWRFIDLNDSIARKFIVNLNLEMKDKK